MSTPETSPQTPASRQRWYQSQAREIRRRLAEQWGPAWARLLVPEVLARVYLAEAAQVVLGWDEETADGLSALRAINSIRGIVLALEEG